MNQTPGEPAWDGILDYVTADKATYVWPHATTTDTLPANNNPAEVRAEAKAIQKSVEALWDAGGPPDDEGRRPKVASTKYMKDKNKLIGECIPAYVMSPFWLALVKLHPLKALLVPPSA
jgi:hypothetical protein